MDTTEKEKLRILVMWECGKTTGEIAKAINKSTRTVQRWLSLQKKEGNMQKKERGRRPRKTTPEEDAKIVQFVKENPDLTQKEILTICNINIYKGTLRRRLQEAKTGGLDLDLFKGSKGGKGKRTKKGSKKSATDSLEPTVPSETEQMTIDAMHATLDAHCLNYDHQQCDSSVDTKSLNFDHQQQYSNDGTHYDHDGVPVSYADHVSVPAGEDGLYVITETIQESSQSEDADHVFNELITDATRMVKIEMAEPQTSASALIPVPSEAEALVAAKSECESTIDEKPDVKPKRKRIRRHGVAVKTENVAVEVTDANQDEHENQEIITIKIKQETKAARKRKVKLEPDDNETESTSTDIDTKIKVRRAKRSDERRGRAGRRRKIKDEEFETKPRTKKDKINWLKDGKDTTDIEKSKILIMTECGMSTSEIAKSLKKSRRTVQRWLSKHNKGLDMERKERGRRPRKTSTDEDARIVQFVKENPHLSRKEVLQFGNINLHKVTLKNRLNEAGIFFNSQGVKILDFTNNEEAAQSLNTTDNYNLLYFRPDCTGST